MENKELKRRILEISYKHNLSHLGSNLTAVDIIKDIYDIKKPDEKFVLSSGHAGLALYVVQESKGGRDAEEVFNHHGVHPDRCRDCHLDLSTGSLGNGLPIAVGMALADRKKNVYCLISDGECAEGSIWESARIITENDLTNLRIHLNDNNYAAYKESNRQWNWRLEAVVRTHYTDVHQFPFLEGLDAHYYTMTEADYKQALEVLDGK
jgi:transketolase